MWEYWKEVFRRARSATWEALSGHTVESIVLYLLGISRFHTKNGIATSVPAPIEVATTFKLSEANVRPKCGFE